MANSAKKLSKDLLIINELGLHARSAALIAKLAQNARSKVWIIKDGEKADAASIIDILSLSCPKDTRIKLTIDNYVDINILEDISNLVEEGFGE